MSAVVLGIRPRVGDNRNMTSALSSPTQVVAKRNVGIYGVSATHGRPQSSRKSPTGSCMQQLRYRYANLHVKFEPLDDAYRHPSSGTFEFSLSYDTVIAGGLDVQLDCSETIRHRPDDAAEPTRINDDGRRNQLQIVLQPESKDAHHTRLVMMGELSLDSSGDGSHRHFVSAQRGSLVRNEPRTR